MAKLDPLVRSVGRRGHALERMWKTLELNLNYAVGREVIARRFASQEVVGTGYRQNAPDGGGQRHDRSLSVMGSLYGVAGLRDKALKTLAELEREAGRRRDSPYLPGRRIRRPGR